MTKKYYFVSIFSVLVLKFEKKSEENTSSDSDNSEGEEEHEEKQSQSQSSKTENSLSEGKKSVKTLITFLPRVSISVFRLL